MIEKYIYKKLNESLMLAPIAIPALYSIATSVATQKGMGLYNKIRSIYNQNFYSKKDCSMILDPDERLKCELYTKMKISKIRLDYLYKLKSKSSDDKEIGEIEKYINKEQKNIMKYSQSLASM